MTDAEVSYIHNADFVFFQIRKPTTQPQIFNKIIVIFVKEIYILIQN